MAHYLRRSASRQPRLAARCSAEDNATATVRGDEAKTIVGETT
jgi:hypothetical protein